MRSGRADTLTSRLATLSSWAGAIVALVGAGVLTGWIFDVEALKTIYGPITMKANASIALLLCGASLWLLSTRPGPFGIALAACGPALGFLTLFQHVTGIDLGIDQLLFTEIPNAAATASPNRMGAHASLSFVFAGTALVLLHLGRAVAVAQALSFIA